MQAILQARLGGRLRGIAPVLVISSKPDAAGVDRAAELRVPDLIVKVISPTQDRKSPERFGEALLEACEAAHVDWIGQYGWMPKTPLNVVRRYQGQMINQHPGPLDPGRPDFGGKGMYGRRVLCASLLYARRLAEATGGGRGKLYTEVTAQRVDEQYDLGAVLSSRRVLIHPEDTLESLQVRALSVEHDLQIKTLQAIDRGDLKEVVRETPLIPEEHLSLLQEAKQIAALMYPEG
ncbi:MAG: hypothetical protein RL141_490 [Candidatus Parcubacteria bacterium]